MSLSSAEGEMKRFPRVSHLTWRKPSIRCCGGTVSFLLPQNLKTYNFQIKMTFTSLRILTLLGMFCGTLCMVEIGRYIQAGWLARNPDGVKISTGTIDA